MSSRTFIVKIPTASPEAKQTLINQLVKISEGMKETEPDALRYAVVEPREESDDKTVWMLEEFKDQAAFDAHQASEPVRSMNKFSTALLSGAPSVINAESSSSFTRPEISNHSDPFIVYATINYKEGKRAEALEGWRTVTSETEKNEPETLSYSILKDNDNELNIHTLEVYASQDYFRKVHVPSEAVKANKQTYGDEIRTGISWQQLKLIGGFFHK